jgi:histidinol-phosphatase (PHP family)
MARAALAAGLEGVAFTDHLEWMPRDDAAGYLKPAAYFAELASLRASCRGESTLLAGLEVGSSHHFLPQARAALSAWPWDYVLGSVHWSGGELGYDPETFADGIAAAYERYFRRCAFGRGGEYDVLAHFDLMRRDSWSTVGACLPAEPYAPS